MQNILDKLTKNNILILISVLNFQINMQNTREY